MSYPKKIIPVSPSGGIAADIPPHEAPPDVYTSGSNVVFREGYAERVQGYAQVYGSPSATLRAIHNAQIAGVNYWIYHGTSSQYVVTVSTHTNVTKAGLSSVTAPNSWTVGLFNGLPIANNANNEPMYWDGNIANDFVTLPGWTASEACYSLRAYRNFLVAMNLTTGSGVYPQLVRWSSAAAAGSIPSTWTPGATVEAGSAILSETGGAIVDGESLGQSFVIYKDHSCYLMTYTGGAQFMNVRPLFKSLGLFSRNCASEFPGGQFVVSDGDIVVHNGTSATSVAERRMKRFLFNQVDQTNFRSTFVVRYAKTKEMWVCFPIAGATFCTHAIVWNWGMSGPGAWGVRELPTISCANTGIINDTAPARNWDSFTGVKWDTYAQRWNQQSYNGAEDALVLGVPNDATPASSRFFRVDSGNTFNGTNVNASLGKYSMALEDPKRVKFVKRVHPRLTGTTGTVVYVRIGSQMAENDAISWSAEAAYTIGISKYADLFTQGKLISVEFRSDSLAPWKLTGFDLEGEIRGYH